MNTKQLKIKDLEQLITYTNDKGQLLELGKFSDVLHENSPYFLSLSNSIKLFNDLNSLLIESNKYIKDYNFYKIQLSDYENYVNHLLLRGNDILNYVAVQSTKTIQDYKIIDIVQKYYVSKDQIEWIEVPIYEFKVLVEISFKSYSGLTLLVKPRITKNILSVLTPEELSYTKVMLNDSDMAKEEFKKFFVLNSHLYEIMIYIDKDFNCTVWQSRDGAHNRKISFDCIPTEWLYSKTVPAPVDKEYNFTLLVQEHKDKKDIIHLNMAVTYQTLASRDAQIRNILNAARLNGISVQGRKGLIIPYSVQVLEPLTIEL